MRTICASTRTADQSPCGQRVRAGALVCRVGHPVVSPRDPGPFTPAAVALSLEDPTLVELFGEGPPPSRDAEGRLPAVVFDRDGTLASVAHARRPDAGPDGAPLDWEDFNAGLLFDAPSPGVAALYRAVRPGVARIVTSGRSESLRPRLVDWLFKHDLAPDELHLRPERDTRADATVKSEIYEQRIAPRFAVRLVVDDRPSVVDMWRRHGLAVLAVADAEVEPPIGGEER